MAELNDLLIAIKRQPSFVLRGPLYRGIKVERVYALTEGTKRKRKKKRKGNVSMVRTKKNMIRKLLQLSYLTILLYNLY